MQKEITDRLLKGLSNSQAKDTEPQSKSIEGLSNSQKKHLASHSFVADAGALSSLPSALKPWNGKGYSSRTLMMPRGSLPSLLDILHLLRSDEFLKHFKIMFVDLEKTIMDSTPLFDLHYLDRMKHTIEVIARNA